MKSLTLISPIGVCLCRSSSSFVSLVIPTLVNSVVMFLSNHHYVINYCIILYTLIYVLQYNHLYKLPSPRYGYD